MSEIVVVGGINMDLHLFDVHRYATREAPLVAEHYLAQPGGKGANVARAVARLGASVRLVGRVGDDEFGHECLRAISDGGVDTRGVALTPRTPTGFVAIQLDEGKHRSLLFAPGANASLGWEDVREHVAGLGSSDVVIAQAEVPQETISMLTSHTRETGVPLFFDPTPPDRVTSEAISRSEVITPNRLEAAALVGRVDTSPLWPHLAARELIAAGASRVIVKLGAEGAILADSGSIELIPTAAVEPVDETGAGDVFLATLAVGRVEGLAWPQATRLANVAAAISLSREGLALPGRQEVDATMQSIS